MFSTDDEEDHNSLQCAVIYTDAQVHHLRFPELLSTVRALHQSSLEYSLTHPLHKLGTKTVSQHFTNVPQ